jgi:N-methylhydantoinase B
LNIDPIALETMGSILESIAREMGIALMQTAYSTIIREEKDFSAAVYDKHARLLGQAEHCPGHQGTLSYCAKHIVHKLKMPLEPGDIIIHNHPYLGGTHHPDIMIFKPIFHEGELVGLAGATGHHLDVGGNAPGSMGSHSTDVWQEGLLIPPLKLFARGEPNHTLHEMIKHNIRVPEKTMGDIRAQISAVSIGERRFLEVLNRYGVKRFYELVEHYFDNSEALMRYDLSQIPPGDYEEEGFLDDDGLSDKPVRIKVKLTFANGGVTVDFAGTSDQTEGPFNCSESSVFNAVFCGIRYLVNPLIFQNEGCYRPVYIVAPEGTVVNPIFPAPLSGRIHTLERITNTILLAFSKASPEKAVGSSHAHLTANAIGGRSPDNRRQYVFFEILGGGWGATSEHDGNNAVYLNLGNCMDLPVEAIELELPDIRVERYELVADSGGPGKFRGGLGIRRDYRFLRGPGYLTTRSDAQKSAPKGVLGGLDGVPARYFLKRRGETVRLKSKNTNLRLETGDYLSFETPGGGGYGDPRDRARERILDDLRQGYISKDAAEKYYGVKVE